MEASDLFASSVLTPFVLDVCIKTKKIIIDNIKEGLVVVIEFIQYRPIIANITK